ncbi:hypothetical protein H4R24_002354 [Coemansia sp. RSA 988]|nr:hypothetical protein H4R24_002354 [Coemansia sp. RSA 988]
MIHASRQSTSWSTPKNTEHSMSSNANKEEYSEVESIWEPPYPAKTRGPVKLTYSHEIAGERDSSYADMLNAWMCPEVDNRISLARARRRKAQQLAEKMNARAHAEKLEQQGQAKRGRKRKNSVVSDSNDAVAPNTPPLAAKSKVCMPISPEVTKPQSLLIPELFPKGMLRQRTQSDTVPKADKLNSTDKLLRKSPMPPPPLNLISGSSNVAHTNGPSLGLGLDLGFDIAQPTPKQEQLTDSLVDTSATILEITDFLEKNVDVFTPMSLTHTPRTATFPCQPSISMSYTTGPSNRLALGSKDRQRELIDDILNMSV